MNPDRYRQLVDLVVRVRHDASNPLTAALGNVQLLLEDPALPDGEIREGLHVVEQELRRLASLMRELNTVKLEGAEPYLE